MRAAVVFCALFAYAWAEGYGNQGGLGGGLGGGRISSGSLGGSLGGGRISSGSLGGSLGGGRISTGSIGGGGINLNSLVSQLGAGTGTIQAREPTTQEILARVGQPSQEIVTVQFDLSQLNVASSSPEIEVGEFGAAFGQQSQTGEVTFQEGEVMQGETSERDGGFEVGRPVEQLIGYTVERQHERVVPITQTRFRVTPVVSSRVQEQPIVTRYYRKQPISVRTQHRVNNQQSAIQQVQIQTRPAVQQQSVLRTSPIRQTSGGLSGGYGGSSGSLGSSVSSGGYN